MAWKAPAEYDEVQDGSMAGRFRLWKRCASTIALLVLAMGMPMSAQDRRAAVVPESDAKALVSAEANLTKAQRELDDLKARVLKKIVPEGWSCCVYQWSTDFRVVWPEPYGGTLRIGSAYPCVTWPDGSGIKGL